MKKNENVNENVEGYAQNKSKGRELMQKSFETKIPFLKKHYRKQANRYYDRAKGYEKILDNPGTTVSHTETHVTFDFSKTKTTEIKNNNVKALSDNSKSSASVPKKPASKKNSKKPTSQKK